jgi:hypothetical protein
MSSEFESPKNPDPQPGPVSQQVQHTSVAARVPEDVGRGVVSTAVMVFHTQHEFVIDFLATMVRPPQVAARLVMSPVTFSQLIRGLQTNLEKYEQTFGKLTPREPLHQPPAADQGASPQSGAGGESPGAVAGQPVGGVESQMVGVGQPAAGEASVPKEPGQPVQQQPQRIEDIYEQLKLPDEMLGGVFSNVAMIRHTPEEFCFDFIANFYPRSVVTKRVYMSAGRVPSLLATMTDSFEQFRRKAAGGQGGPSGPAGG